MASQEQLRRQLESLGELRTVVKTMKALSAVSIHQYEDAVDAVGAYYETIERGLHVVLANRAREQWPRETAEAPERAAAIVFGSDHGLCGRFNEDIARHATDQLGRYAVGRGRPTVLAVGEQAAAALEGAGQAPAERHALPGSAPAIADTVERLLIRIDRLREERRLQAVWLFYNCPTEARGYEPTSFTLLPVGRARFDEWRERPWPSRCLPVHHMPAARLLARLVRQYLFVSLYRACAQSQASEHASRLSAMQAAERNLDERLDDVTTAYRRARQSAITSELLDVVAGFETTRTARHH
jgi:F-type H+-transporting ATPase subunit gamma